MKDRLVRLLHLAVKGRMTIPENTYYERLRERAKERSLDLDDVNELVVPLLLSRGQEIKAIHDQQDEQIRRSNVKSNVLYAFSFVVMVICVAAGSQIAVQQGQIKQQAREQREGRAIGVATNCAIQSAVIKAAVQTITHGSDYPPAFQRNIERLGYPPKSVIRKQSKEVSKRFSLQVSRAVEQAARDALSKQPGRPPAARERPSVATGIVRPDGMLDCRKLAVLSKVSSTGVPPT